MSLSNTLQVVPVTTLNSHEEKEDLDKWYGVLKAQLKTSRYKDYMYKTWSAKNAQRGQPLLLDAVWLIWAIFWI